MTRSTGRRGLIRRGSPPRRARAARIAARSTTAGTPVKSCIRTRAGRKGISGRSIRPGAQAATARTSWLRMRCSSTWRRTDSSSRRIEKGSRSSCVRPACSSAVRPKMVISPACVARRRRARKASFGISLSSVVLGQRRGRRGPPAKAKVEPRREDNPSDWGGGGFYVADPVRRTLRCVVATGTPATILGTVLQFGEGAAGKVAETGAPVRVDDYRIWPGRSPQFEKSAPFRAVVSVPTLLHGQVTGVLHVLRTSQGQPFNQNDVDLLNIFANQAGAALENARLLEETNLRVRQLSILNDLTRAALTANDLASMSQVLAEQMGALVGADGCHLVLWDPSEGVAVPMAASGVLRGVYAQMRPRPGQMTLTESALRAGRPVPVEDCLNTPYLSPQIAEGCPYRSMLGVPLVVGERWMGAVLLAYR